MKIFGIGLSKTGTTSLARALEILGYRTKDYLGIVTYTPGDLSSIDMSIVEENDAFTDTPIPSFYKELDTEYPDSKFILTVRGDMDGWLKSCKKQFTQKLADKQNEAHKKLFMDLYGCTVFDEQQFIKGYKKFVGTVQDYFKDRPHDLLIYDITAGDGWEKLCSFLNKPIPEIAFPKANVTQIRWMNIQKIISIARHAGEELLTAYCIKHGKRAENPRLRLGAMSSLKPIMARMRYAVAKDLHHNASKRAYRIIRDGLQALNSEVPILTPQGSNVPYGQRRTWNHLWLVDPLENLEGFIGGTGNFTVNIALIEDRKPIMGVVYAPLINTIYYGSSGKGAFLCQDEEEPQSLTPFEADSNSSSETKGDMPGMFTKQREKVPGPISKALSICQIAEGISDINRTIDGSMEWETAAAQSVVDQVGIKIKDCKTSKELTYNKEMLANGCISFV